MDEGRRRLDYRRADPRVSLTVLAVDDWYTHVSLCGRVVELADDEGLAGIDRLSCHYRGRALSAGDRGRVNAWIEVDSWHRWARRRPTAADRRLTSASRSPGPERAGRNRAAGLIMTAGATSHDRDGVAWRST